MSFSSGTVSLRRFHVIGKQGKTVEQDHLDRLAAHVLDEDSPSRMETEYGWCGGRHLLDTRFDFEHNVFNDSLSFALRVDTNRVPADLRRAYRQVAEDELAAGNPSGFLSKKQKSDANQTLLRKVEKDLQSGRFRRGKMTPVLWDFAAQTVYAPAGPKTTEYLTELFERTFELELFPASAGTLARSMLEPLGRRRDYEDLRPTRFVPGQGGEGQYPEYPWTAKGPQPKDFLGNEFLLWLWHEADVRNGSIPLDSNDVTIFFDRFLDLDCAYGESGRAGLRATGPTQMPEARDAIRTGKVPRKAGMVLDIATGQFNFTFNAENFSISSMTMPEVPHADTPRTLFEERIGLLRDLHQNIDGMYQSFLKIRCTSKWESQTASIRKWILQTAKPAIAVA
ncbi:MAG: hypothetical protein ABSG31_13020 [Tepidisphaeraceae bacterium]|jgi:hypothetical protein